MNYGGKIHFNSFKSKKLAATLLSYRAEVTGTAIHGHPQITRASGLRSRRAPGQSEGEGAAEEPKKGEGCPAFAIKSSYFPLSG